MWERSFPVKRYRWIGLFVLAAAWASPALAGGTPEEAFLIVDPARTDAMYVANYYRHVRDVPSVNVLYMDPTAPDYTTFDAENLVAVLGMLENRQIRDHIHYHVVPPASSFYVHAPGLVFDGCAPVSRFSISACYTLMFQRSAIFSGNMHSAKPNRYFGLDNTPYGFDSTIKWKDGAPSTDGRGHFYFIGASLGYTGERGNTLEEIIAMIDRSVAVDGTFPAGTFYYMETTDELRSGPRDDYYPTAVADITALGGSAEHLFDVLPIGRHDCLGIMTGWASPDIEGADLTILPGAICDHLTSYAATFDTSSQTKLSSWIRKGASGSWGAVQEPCNYPGKFPHARVYVWYYQGLSLGEALFRSVGYLPFQGLLYGDPLTRPFAALPTVDVPDAPPGTVSGPVTLTPVATATCPGAEIAELSLLIDGVVHSLVGPGEPFVVDTSELPDGWHDMRVLAYDDTVQRFTGRWLGELTTDNRGRSATLDVTPDSGNWTTAFEASVAGTGADVAEVRLLHNGRVVAAAAGCSAQLTVYGLTLGAGPVQVQAEALYVDGERVRSEPQALQVDYAGGTPSGAAPVAFSYTKHVLGDAPFVVELPAAFDDPDTALTYTLLTEPVQATVAEGTGPYRIMWPDPLTEGTDEFTFQVDSAVGSSDVATVSLIYVACIGDLNGDGQVDLSDLTILLSNYGQTEEVEPEDGDLDRDGDVDLNDLSTLLAHYGIVCE
jgi:hypothetical protein